MEDRQVGLFSRAHVVLFVLLMAGAVYLLLPKRSDIASLRLSASQVESLQLTKEGLDPSVFSDQPKLIRLWVGLLREDGRTAEALRFARELVRLRPRNKLYWEILRQALIDENLQSEELGVRLKLIAEGTLEAKRLDYLRIATAYKWLGQEADYVSTLETMVERGVHGRDEIESLLQAYSAPSLSEAAREAKLRTLLERLRAKGGLSPAIHETLAVFQSAMGKPREAALHAALAAGLSEDAAREFADAREAGPAFLASAAALPSRKLESLVDLANFHGRGQLSTPLYEMLRERGALNFTRYFDYIHASLKLERKPEAVRLAREIPRRLRLDDQQWFQLAQMLGALGQREQSIRIMQRLLAEPTSGRPGRRG